MPRDLQYVLDYIEIRELSARYNRATDSADGTTYAQLFTEDGELDMGDRIFRGHGELEQIANMDSVTLHSTCDPLIEIDGDTARQSSRLIVTSKPADGGPNEFICTGFYIDELRRTPDGWRFQHRRLESDYSTEEARRKLGITELFDDLVRSGAGS